MKVNKKQTMLANKTKKCYQGKGMREMKQKNPMECISMYMKDCKTMVTLGKVLATISAFMAMIPYYEIWKIIRICVKNNDFSSIPSIAWKAVAIMLISMLLYIAALVCTHIAAFRVQANMRTELMEHISKLPLGIFDKEGTGKIRRIITDSTAATETYIAHNIPDKAVASATPVGLLILMLVFDWKIGLICLIPAAIGFFFMSQMMTKDMQEKMKEYQNSLEVMSNEAVEYVRGIPVVKTFSQTVFSFKRFKKAIDDYSAWCIAYTKLLTMPMVGFMTCINALFVAILVCAYIFSMHGISSNLVLNIMYYIIVTPLLTLTLTKMAYAGEQEMTVLDAMQRVHEILDIQPLEDNGHEVSEDYSICFDHVNYRYPQAKQDAVHDLSLMIPSGKHVAFVGPSGGGKTTAVNLVARFFDVSSGSIQIGGKNVKDISHKDLMKMVSFVFQDSHLLKGSILDNVRLAKKEASEQEVLQALQKAQCMDIIEKLPEGIHTVIGSKGTYLSGGEQQRIAIARAFLKDSPILILDEATAFADPDNETKVQKAFEELTKNKTVIMIAHRLTTVVNVDEIFVLQNGMCVEHGNHEALMAKDTLYKKMFNEYEKSISWKVGA